MLKGKLQEEKLSEKAAETFAWISAEVKMMLNDDSSKDCGNDELTGQIWE